MGTEGMKVAQRCATQSAHLAQSWPTDRTLGQSMRLAQIPFHTDLGQIGIWPRSVPVVSGLSGPNRMDWWTSLWNESISGPSFHQTTVCPWGP